MLVSVQYARAVAALLVVVAHLSGFSAFQPVTTAHFGSFGVDIFFVISGFIMWETSKNQRPRDFMHRRIARIAPPYWFYTTLLVLLALFVPRMAPNIELSWKAVLGSYLFIPYTDHRGIMNPILLQGWTLNFEMYFYVIFAASLFLANRPARFIAVAGVFIASAVIGLAVDKSWAILSQILSPVLMEFVLGMVVSIARQRWKINPRGSLLIIVGAIACLILADLQQPSADLRFFFFGVPAALFLFGLLGTETYLAPRRLGFLVAAGDASYSLYLAHPFVLSAVHIAVNGPVRNRLGIEGIPLGLLFAALAVFLSLIFSYSSFIFLEKPAGRFMLERLSGRKKDGGKTGIATA